MQWQLLSVLFFVAQSAKISALEGEECDAVLFFFKCENSLKCISHTFVCDGKDDCGDASDENIDLCTNEIPSYGDVCKPYEYRCIDRSHCISEQKYCDGIEDCDDGSDELENCNQNRTCNGFKCKSGRCILDAWVCDGIEDCNDGNDELNCSNSRVIPSSQCNNNINKYLCDNKRCIDLDFVCNSIDNCGDGSDEDQHECARAQKSCNYDSLPKPCLQKCIATPKGYQCACENGYFLNDQQYSCEDVNECERYGLCDQTCINTLGSYYCQCEIGYNLEKDGHSCKPADGEALMLFASKTSIQGYYLDSKIHFSMVDNLYNIVGLTFDSKYVYWTDIQVGKETIYRTFKNGTNREAVVTSGLGCPDDIAVDWITGNFYFTDSVNKRIGACNDNGIYCTVVVSDNVKKLRGISLSPLNGKMYWTDWGKNPHISVANMDGSNSKIFIGKNILWPNGLTIDYVNERLYWIDAKLKTVESIQLDGQDRRTIIKAKHPYSVAVFGNRIYWSDWSTNSIHSCNKFNGENVETLLKTNETLYGMHIYHSTLNIKSENPCASNPCSDLCLLTENKKYSCACTLDKELDTDRHTCKHKEEQNYFTIAAGNMIINYYRELLGRPEVTFNVTEDHISALAYDPFTGTLIAGGGNKKELYRYNAYTGDFNDIRPVATDVDGCIAFDYLGGNLYKSSAQNKLIQVQSSEGNKKIEFSYDERPLDLILIPEEGAMFVVFESESNDMTYSITRLPIDGVNGKVHVVEKNLKGPKISLAYDEKDNRVFWSDEGGSSIWSVNSKGEDKKLLRSDIVSPASIAIFGTDIYWISRGSTLLSWTDKKGLSSKIKSLNLPIQQSDDSPILRVIEGNKTNYTHPCRLNNGNCSHICLVTNLTESLCTCPPDLIIDADGKSCRVKGFCVDNEVKCSKTEKCINKDQRCNGVDDCENGEDEMQCKNIPFPNKFTDFTYRNGKLFVRTDNATVYELDDEHY